MTPSLLERIAARLSAEREIFLEGLAGGGLPCLLAALVRMGRGPFLVVAPDGAAAEKTLNDLSFFLGSRASIRLFPCWEVLPYENLSPHRDVVSQRLSTLYALTEGPVDLVVTTIPAVMQRVMPKRTLVEGTDYIVAGEEIPFDPFLKGLVERGYVRTLQVEEMGEFSVRGGIVDVFGPAMENPVRIEFFGDEVVSVRPFDILTQRSAGEPLEELILLPAGEAFLRASQREETARRVRARGRRGGLPRENFEEIGARLADGIHFQGVEFFLPDFFPESATLFDYLPGDITTVRIDPEEIAVQGEAFEASVCEGYEKALADGWPFPPREGLYLTAGEALTRLGAFPALLAGGVRLGTGEPLSVGMERNLDIRISLEPAEKGGESPLEPLAERLRGWRDEGMRVVLAAHTRGQAERLRDLLVPYGLPLVLREGLPDPEGAAGEIVIHVGELSCGFQHREGKVVFIAEEEIFGERHRRRGSLKRSADLQITSFGQLKPMDYVVHVDHGIGIYRGLTRLTAGGTTADYLEIEYQGGDRVFVPVDRLNLVQRYAGGEGEVPRIDKLGGTAWEKAKKKVRKAVADMAAELMEIYAARAVMEGYAYPAAGDEFREFEAAFEYEETPDQQGAIDDVLADLAGRRPMDRLVCGDVGYGKTEVAMRAAFLVAMAGRQVAVLVPTTVLAQQHHQTFSDRFKGYPLKVERLTRFCGPERQKAVLKGLEEGKVDVVIGTHRLLQKDVKFKNLGLVVVDEEQRFGVAHKERLKKIRKTVDVLTLTATPIPRTLHMSMMGIRDLSIISSPPEGRLAIKTVVTRFDEELIREAIQRELRRGGQVFFVHNRIQDIENMAARLRAIVPEARIAIGHGQMHETELEEVMLRFDEGETNLLLCTTIIESGLDIPNANTIIINNANAMGLAQLYQLRGRVGRSRHRAYAYLIIPAETLLTKEARKRLQAIQDMRELGSGFHLASYDLEIRGAGNIVGAEQSGNIEAVGFELFQSMLEQAVAALKGEDIREEIEPEIRFPVPALIPEEYVEDTHQRLGLYKRLSSIREEEEIAEMKAELLDRFGPVPSTVLNFLELIALKILLKRALVKEAVISDKGITFVFHERANPDVDKILALVRSAPRKYTVTPDGRLRIVPSSTDWLKSLDEGKKVLKGLMEL